MTKARAIYAADFETTTDPADCRVWLWGYAKITDPGALAWGTDIASFIRELSNDFGHSSIMYFHNLKFDGHFIIDWLLKNNYHLTKSKKLNPMTFSTLVSNMGKMYTVSVMFPNGKRVEFRDSLKKLPMSVSRIAEAFKLPMSKGDLDYHAHRPVGYLPTDAELDYLQRDVEIVARALGEVIAEGMVRLTVASDSLAEYKRLTGGEKMFRRTFPLLSEDVDSEIRRAYRGGFTYADSRFSGNVRGSGIVLDVNSLYPFVMYNDLLPYGEPEYVAGRVKPTKAMPLAIFAVELVATLKPGHIPCIQIKGSSMFGETEYLSEIVEPTTIVVTNVDFDLYSDHYDITVLQWLGGWRFKGAVGLFDSYIEKWSDVKANSVGGKREIAKLHLNSLYGRFGTNPNVTGKYPVLDNERVKYVTGEDERKEPVYTPIAVFVTSYARNLTIRAAQANYDIFAYADTDSLHLLGDWDKDNIPPGLNVHPTNLGAWKFEYQFTKALFVRAKFYLEQVGDDVKVVCAGMPERISNDLTFDDVYDGNELHGKLIPRSVPGGLVLEDTTFTIKL